MSGRRAVEAQKRLLPRPLPGKSPAAFGGRKAPRSKRLCRSSGSRAQEEWAFGRSGSLAGGQGRSGEAFMVGRPASSPARSGDPAGAQALGVQGQGAHNGLPLPSLHTHPQPPWEGRCGARKEAVAKCGTQTLPPLLRELSLEA